MSPIRNTRQGFTLIELLVVISIIAILAGLLLPAITMVKGKANQTACANNQKQIVTAMVAYSIDYDGSYPLYHSATLLTTSTTLANTDMEKITKLSLEILAASGTMPGAVFKCKSASGTAPNSGAKVIPTEGTPWADTGTTAMYGYDWTVSGEPASYRIILAERKDNHKGTVICVAVDSSVRPIKATSGTAGSANTSGVDGKIVNAANKDAAGNSFQLAAGTADSAVDNIYDHVKDGPNANDDNGNRCISDSDARRSFVK